MQNKVEKQEFDEHLNHILQQYRVPYPDQDMIDDVVYSLRQYVPSRRRKRILRYERLKRLVKDAAISLNFMELSYWIITFLLYFTGYFVLTAMMGDPYKLVFVLAPLPVILGLLEVFRGREEGVTELEMACRVTPQEIIISKILVVCSYNAVLNLCLTLIVYMQEPVLILWKLTLLWLFPMILTGGLSLWFCSKVRGNYAVAVSLSCWAIAAFILVSQEQLFAEILVLKPWYLIILVSAGIGLFVKEIIKIKKRYLIYGRDSAWN